MRASTLHDATWPRQCGEGRPDQSASTIAIGSPSMQRRWRTAPAMRTRRRRLQLALWRRRSPRRRSTFYAAHRHGGERGHSDLCRTGRSRSICSHLSSTSHWRCEPNDVLARDAPPWRQAARVSNPLRSSPWPPPTRFSAASRWPTPHDVARAWFRRGWVMFVDQIMAERLQKRPTTLPGPAGSTRRPRSGHGRVSRRPSSRPSRDNDLGRPCDHGRRLVLVGLPTRSLAPGVQERVRTKSRTRGPTNAAPRSDGSS